MTGYGICHCGTAARAAPGRRAVESGTFRAAQLGRQEYEAGEGQEEERRARVGA